MNSSNVPDNVRKRVSAKGRTQETRYFCSWRHHHLNNNRARTSHVRTCTYYVYGPRIRSRTFMLIRARVFDIVTPAVQSDPAVLVYISSVENQVKTCEFFFVLIFEGCYSFLSIDGVLWRQRRVCGWVVAARRLQWKSGGSIQRLT